MKLRFIALVAVVSAVSFAGGAASHRLWWLAKFPQASVSDGHVSVHEYKLPTGTVSLEVNIYGGGGDGRDALAKDCLTIAGEKGRDGGGDAGDGLFCGDKIAIMPGHAGAAGSSSARPGEGTIITYPAPKPGEYNKLPPGGGGGG